MFRRKSAGAPESTAQDAPGAQSPVDPAATRPAEAKKGRPTPKRRVAEAGRYQPIGGGRRPAGPRSPQDKARDRSERARKYEAMKRGEDWALNPKDRGPVRAYVRDYVDSRRRLIEYSMFILLVLFVGILFSRTVAVQIYVDVVMVLVLAMFIVQGFIFRRTFSKVIPERFPGESTRGLTGYALMRAMQFRRFRVPAPRVGPDRR